MYAGAKFCKVGEGVSDFVWLCVVDVDLPVAEIVVVVGRVWALHGLEEEGEGGRRGSRQKLKLHPELRVCK